MQRIAATGHDDAMLGEPFHKVKQFLYYEDSHRQRYRLVSGTKSVLDDDDDGE